METKRRGGWWALAAVVAGSVLLLLAVYVGAYFATVEEAYWAGPPTEVVAIYPKCDWDWINPDPLFEPIHRIDRNWLRPQKWTPIP